MPSLRQPTRRPARLAGAVAISLLALAAALAGLAWLSGTTDTPRGPVVYCAAAVRPAIEPLLKAYHAERGLAALLRVGPSGALEAQIRLSERGDLFIPAAADPFLERLNAEGLVNERMPLARLRLVLALAPEVDERPESLRELIDFGVPYGVCNEQAAAGQKAREAATAAGLWEQLNRGATASLPTVTELAAAVRDGGRLQAGLVWRVTAEQFELTVVETPELIDAVGQIEIGVLRSSEDPTAAVELARFLREHSAAIESAGYEVP